MRQEVALEAGAQDEFSAGQNTAATAVGTDVGGLLGSGVSILPDAVRKVFNSGK